MAIINFEKMDDRNKVARSYLEKAMEILKDADKDDCTEKVFNNVREASMLLEVQRVEIEKMQHMRLSEMQNDELMRIVANYQSVVLMRDRIVHC